MSDNTQPSAAHVVARAIAQSQSASDEASDGCWICQQQLWISVFFDEPGHDAVKERGTHRLSSAGLAQQLHGRSHELARACRRLFHGIGKHSKKANAQGQPTC